MQQGPEPRCGCARQSGDRTVLLREHRLDPPATEAMPTGGWHTRSAPVVPPIPRGEKERIPRPQIEYRSLRRDFARSPADVAWRLCVRPSDLKAFVGIDPAALEGQAEPVTRTWRRRALRPGAEHALASVGANGRSVLGLAAETRRRNVAVTSITHFYRLLTTHFCCVWTLALRTPESTPRSPTWRPTPPEDRCRPGRPGADTGHLLLQDLLPVVTSPAARGNGSSSTGGIIRGPAARQTRVAQGVAPDAA